MLFGLISSRKDVAMHLLVTRYSTGGNFLSWFVGCPLTIAASNNSLAMVRMLLEVGYDFYSPYKTGRNPSSPGSLVAYDVNRALLETICRKVCKPGLKASGSNENVAACSNFPTEEKSEYFDSDTDEIIRLLIEHGANPHTSVSLLQTGKADNFTRKGDIDYRDQLNDDTPLFAAVSAADANAVKCMLDAHSRALESFRALRRKDPILCTQPESYFQILERKEDDVVHSSLQVCRPGASLNAFLGAVCSPHKFNVVFTECIGQVTISTMEEPC